MLLFLYLDRFGIVKSIQLVTKRVTFMLQRAYSLMMSLQNLRRAIYACRYGLLESGLYLFDTPLKFFSVFGCLSFNSVNLLLYLGSFKAKPLCLSLILLYHLGRAVDIRHLTVFYDRFQLFEAFFQFIFFLP